MTAAANQVRKQLLALALTLPGAHEDHPWGETVVKVDGKVFVFLGMASNEGGLGLSVKLPRSGEEALDLPFCTPTSYGLGKSGWVSAKFPKGEEPPLGMLRDWLLESYRAVAKKKRLEELDAKGSGEAQPKTKTHATKSATTKAKPTTRAAKTATVTSTRSKSATKR